MKKRFMAVVAAAFLCLTLFPATARAEQTSDIVFSPTFGQTEARSMLDMINAFRTGDEAFYWNETNTAQVSSKGDPLTYSYALEEIAMRRAAEIALNFSHTRPDNTSCFTARASDNSQAWGENIAAGTSTASAAFKLWREDDENYSGQGHRRNMLAQRFRCVGVGHVAVGGTHYWVQEFGDGADNMPETEAVDEARPVTIAVAPSLIRSIGNLSVSRDSIELEAGSRAEIPAVSASIKLSGAWPGRETVVDVAPVWTSGDEAVCAVDGQDASGVAAGSTTLTGAAFGQTVSVSVTVGAGEEPVPADGVWAILYEDGELVFQNGNATEPGRTVANTYEVDLDAIYDYPSYEPWYNERESVRVVNFKDKISPTSTACWFNECLSLERVDNIQNLDTANVTNMFYMFKHCSALTMLDVSHFDTTNVENMCCTFWVCSKLTELDVSGWNTSNVTNMLGLFGACGSLKKLDVSNFDTANVTNMANMFFRCETLTELDVSKFDTAKVTDMSGMFEQCTSLKSLDVSGFKTDNVTDMNFMFNFCAGLQTLDVSKFDTAKVTNMEYMFNLCGQLAMLDVSNFETANVTKMNGMFRCGSLKTIYASDKFTTASVTDGGDMFSGCMALVGGAGTKYDSGHVDKTYARIDTPDAPGYFTAKDAPADIAYAVLYADGELVFQNGDAAESGRTVMKTYPVDLTTPYQYGSYAPWHGERESVRVANFAEKISPVSTAYWFYQCENLERVDNLENLDTANVTDMSGMFYGCGGLVALDLSGFDTANVADMYGMFYGCSKLKTIRASDKFATASVREVDDYYGSRDMFAGCAALVGGNGTKYDANRVDKTYARIDAPSAPGYFTDKDAPDGKTFDVTKDAYAFGNNLADFGYTSRGPGAASYPIPAKSFFLMFGESVAGKMTYSRIAKTSVWNGNCAGMSGSVALVNPADFGKEDVWSLTIADTDGEISVKTFVEAMQVAQYTEAFAKARAEHSFEYGQSLMPLALAVRDAAAQGRPTLIAIVKEKVGGHALLAVGAEDVSDAGATLQIYDCNHPGELQSLTIANTSEWRYDMGGYGVWGDSSCSVAYVPYETLESIWEHRGNPRAMCETLTVNAENVSVTNYADEEVAKLVNGKLVTDRADVYEMPELSMYWPKERTIFLPKDYYNVSSEDDITLEATMTDQRMSASISTTANTVSFAVDDATKSNAVTVENASATDTYSVSLESDFEDVRYKNVTLSGTGQGQTVEISMNQNGKLALSNCNIESLSLDGAAQITYVITANAGEGGSVTPAGDTRLPAETDRTFVFTPDPGYKVRSVKVDNAEMGPRSEYTFQKVIKDHVLVVLFEKVPDAYAITSAAPDGDAYKVTFTNPDAVTVAVSRFDKSGKFLSADLKAVSANAGSVTFPLTDTYKTRVTLLNADYRPLCVYG